MLGWIAVANVITGCAEASLLHTLTFDHDHERLLWYHPEITCASASLSRTPSPLDHAGVGLLWQKLSDRVETLEVAVKLALRAPFHARDYTSLTAQSTEMVCRVY